MEDYKTVLEATMTSEQRLKKENIRLNAERSNNKQKQIKTNTISFYFSFYDEIS